MSASDVQELIKFEPVPLLPPVVLPSASETEYDNGLMLADEAPDRTDVDTSLDMPMTREFTREADCTIGPASSFHLMGGFCKGAQSFRIGGHWQGIHKQTGFVAVSR